MKIHSDLPTRLEAPVEIHSANPKRWMALGKIHSGSRKRSEAPVEIRSDHPKCWLALGRIRSGFPKRWEAPGQIRSGFRKRSVAGRKLRAPAVRIGWRSAAILAAGASGCEPPVPKTRPRCPQNIALCDYSIAIQGRSFENRINRRPQSGSAGLAKLML